MSFLGKSVRFFIYPIARPFETMRDAAGELRRDVATLKAERAKIRAAEIERAKAYAAGQVALDEPVTEEELLNPRLISDPRKRFSVLVDLNQWDDESLAEQKVAVIRGRRFAIGMGAVILIAAIVMFVRAPVWMVMVLSPCMLLGLSVAIAYVVKYGLFEYQLQHRSLVPFREFFSREDFWRRLVS